MKKFLNISNHPSSKWGEEQFHAAKQYGEIIDIPFPNIAPAADTYEVRELVEKVALEVIKPQGHQNDITVHLMGEQSFCFCLASLLKSAGYKVVVSTAAREVRQKEDGTKVVKFNFIQFRRL